MEVTKRLHRGIQKPVAFIRCVGYKYIAANAVPKIGF